MAPTPVKKYTLTGTAWSGNHVEIRHDGLPLLWVNSKNAYGHWKEPYVTIHTDAHNGEIVAAAKMCWKRNFKVWLGNPDCTDLGLWPVVQCKGKWAHEYQFCVDGRMFAWRRTRDRMLGAEGRGRDFKLVALASSQAPSKSEAVPEREYEKEERLIDFEDEKCVVEQEQENAYECDRQQQSEREERIQAIYIHEATWGSSKARIHFFEHIDWGLELWSLAAVVGLQEKIRRNQEAWTMASMSYGGGLRPLGRYL